MNVAEDWLKKLFAKGLFNEQYTNELFEAHIIELANIINSHAAEQRQECADAVTYAWKHRNFDKSSYELMLRDACLNATGENDE